MQISLYNRASDINSQNITDIDLFFDNIKDGQWQDQVFNLRKTSDQAQKDLIKKSLPGVTLSGTFATRKDDAIISHSNLICIDIDHVDPSETKSIVCADEHCFAAFTSCSGKGLAVIFKIDGARHRDAFNGISKYLLDTYSIVVDPTGINPSRLRFVSFDPDLFINKKAKKFTSYIPKKDTTKVRDVKIIFVKNDFDNIIAQLQTKRIDITYDYINWRNVAWGLVDKFGEDGRSYFHSISEISQKYDRNICDRQYSACLKSAGHGITIGTFYYLVKQAGIETYSTETKEIIKIASAQKRSAGMDNTGIIANLKQHSEYNHELIDEVVPQVHSDTFQEDVSLVEHVQNEIRTCWNIRKNVISRYYELEARDKLSWSNMQNPHFNSIYLQIKKHITNCSFDLIQRIIVSNETPDYNPLLSFIEKYKHLKPIGTISKLSSTITSDFGLNPELRERYITKWFVGMISAIHGQHSPLMLVLTGENQNTGKTQWFRRLLPKELSSYYAESKLDQGKDDEILMTQKIIIMDDELGGKSKKEVSRLKELTSKQTFSLREPYGENNVDLERLAVLCGTSNENGVLNDPTGNRRIIPINVISIDHDLYNSIDKIELIIESYWLWHGGYKWEMDKNDIKILNQNTDNFEAVSPEEEMVFRYFKIAKNNFEGDFFTTTDIISHIEIMSRQRMNHVKVGQIFTKNGLKRNDFIRNKKKMKGYRLCKLDYVENTYKSENNTDYPLSESTVGVEQKSNQLDFDQNDLQNDLQEDFDIDCPF